METIVLLIIFALLVAGIFWLLRKNERLSCHECEDHSHLAPYKIEAPTVEQAPIATTPAVSAKPASQKTPRMQPAKKDTIQPKAQQPQQGQKKLAPASKTAPKTPAKQTKNAPVPAKSTPRAPRAKKSNS